MRQHLAAENDAIVIAKEFLRKQKQTLRRRQAGLKAAKQELNNDMLRQQLTVKAQTHSFINYERSCLRPKHTQIFTTKYRGKGTNTLIY